MSDTTLNVRNIDSDAVEEIKHAAAVRGLTVGRYLERLVQLHQIARQQADAGNGALQAELETLGLQTVTG
jgi:hypothetical protein